MADIMQATIDFHGIRIVTPGMITEPHYVALDNDGSIFAFSHCPNFDGEDWFMNGNSGKNHHAVKLGEWSGPFEVQPENSLIAVGETRQANQDSGAKANVKKIEPEYRKKS